MTTPTTFPQRYCPACSTIVPAPFKPGPAGRPDASCPNCASLERHRSLAILLACLQPALGPLDTLLDIAPSPQATPLLARLGARRHVRMDLGADNRLVDVLGSLTDVPLPDDSVDLLVCYHVLEHIPDDRAAMREIARILKPGGLAMLQVPWRPNTVTDEDPSAPEAERKIRFGQADHVRYYGADFEDRLVESGLAFHRVTPRGLLGDRMCALLRLGPDEITWLATPAVGAAVPPMGPVEPTSLTKMMDTLVGLLDSQHAEVVAAQAEVVSAKAAAQAAAQNDPRVRARRLAGRVKRRLRRLLRQARRRLG